MEERYDISVDIGEGKDWWYVHGVTTHDKVYELNKQMCDLESGLGSDFLDMQVRIADKLAKDVIEGVRTPDWAKNMLAGIPEQLSRAEYEILDEILKEKNRFMEEKKTKKMTKAEAFEWLKHKKVYVGGNSAVIQEKLFEAGFEWAENKRNISNLEQPFLILSEGGGIFYSNNMCHYLERSHEEISADDILSIEVVEEADGLKYGSSWDEITRLGAQISKILDDMPGHCRVEITECTVNLYDEGVNLYHSDPF